MINFYTPVMANAILPEIRKRFANILNQRDRILELQSELNILVEQNNGHEKFFNESPIKSNVIFLDNTV